MVPNLIGVDHLHVYVGNRKEAEDWYLSALNFRRVDALMSWAVQGGPLTVENPESTVHLALFERGATKKSSVIAFGATGEEFLHWKEHLEDLGLELRIVDHELAYSIYFNDPWQNMHEITTYDRDYVAEKLET